MAPWCIWTPDRRLCSRVNEIFSGLGRALFPFTANYCYNVMVAIGKGMGIRIFISGALLGPY